MPSSALASVKRSRKKSIVRNIDPICATLRKELRKAFVDAFAIVKRTNADPELLLRDYQEYIAALATALNPSGSCENVEVTDEWWSLLERIDVALAEALSLFDDDVDDVILRRSLLRDMFVECARGVYKRPHLLYDGFKRIKYMQNIDALENMCEATAKQSILALLAQRRVKTEGHDTGMSAACDDDTTANTTANTTAITTANTTANTSANTTADIQNTSADTQHTTAAAELSVIREDAGAVEHDRDMRTREEDDCVYVEDRAGVADDGQCCDDESQDGDDGEDDASQDDDEDGEDDESQDDDDEDDESQDGEDEEDDESQDGDDDDVRDGKECEDDDSQQGKECEDDNDDESQGGQYGQNDVQDGDGDGDGGSSPTAAAEAGYGAAEKENAPDAIIAGTEGAPIQDKDRGHDDEDIEEDRHELLSRLEREMMAETGEQTKTVTLNVPSHRVKQHTLSELKHVKKAAAKKLASSKSTSSSSFF